MAFNYFPGPNYTETETKIFLAADIVELAANSLLACPISTINFILILKTSILHPNLKLILLCQSLCIFIRGIGNPDPAICILELMIGPFDFSIE